MMFIAGIYLALEGWQSAAERSHFLQSSYPKGLLSICLSIFSISCVAASAGFV
jgi:hypothetical protein